MKVLYMQLSVEDAALRDQLHSVSLGQKAWGSAVDHVHEVLAVLDAALTLGDVSTLRCIRLSVVSGGVQVNYRSVLLSVSPTPPSGLVGFSTSSTGPVAGTTQVPDEIGPSDGASWSKLRAVRIDRVDVLRQVGAA